MTHRKSAVARAHRTMQDHESAPSRPDGRRSSFPYLAGAAVAIYGVVLGAFALSAGVPPMAVVVSGLAVAAVTVSAVKAGRGRNA